MPRDLLPRATRLPGRGGPLAFVAGAVTLLAVLLLGAAEGASRLGAAWRGGGDAIVTVLIPPGADPAAVATRLADDPAAAVARPLATGEVARLLQPFVAGDGLPLPSVIEVSLRPGTRAAEASARLQTLAAAIAPGSLAEAPSGWRDRVSALGRIIAALSSAAIGIVAIVVAAITAVVTRAALTDRWDGIVIVHGLGATDTQIAWPLARDLAVASLAGTAAGAIAGALTLAAALAASDDLTALAAARLAVSAAGLGLAIAALAGITAWLTARARLAALP